MRRGRGQSHQSGSLKGLRARIWIQVRVRIAARAGGRQRVAPGATEAVWGGLVLHGRVLPRFQACGSLRFLHTKADTGEEGSQVRMSNEVRKYVGKTSKQACVETRVQPSADTNL